MKIYKKMEKVNIDTVERGELIFCFYVLQWYCAWDDTGSVKVYQRIWGWLIKIGFSVVHTKIESFIFL